MLSPYTVGLKMPVPKCATWLTSTPVYTPPNVAKHGCNVFDGSTGKKKHVQCGYHSVFGRVLEEGEEYISSILAAKAT